MPVSCMLTLQLFYSSPHLSRFSHLILIHFAVMRRKLLVDRFGLAAHPMIGHPLELEGTRPRYAKEYETSLGQASSYGHLGF